MSASNVTPIARVQPKTASRRYKTHPITVTYIVDTKMWKWEVAYTQVVKWGDEAKTLNSAFKAAEKWIDKNERK